MRSTKIVVVSGGGDLIESECVCVCHMSIFNLSHSLFLLLESRRPHPHQLLIIDDDDDDDDDESSLDYFHHFSINRIGENC